MYIVKKHNSKLVIAKDNLIVYQMPFWIKINQRSDLQELADEFNKIGNRCIVSIMNFETKFNTKNKLQKY